MGSAWRRGKTLNHGQFASTHDNCMERPCENQARCTKAGGMMLRAVIAIAIIALGIVLVGWLVMGDSEASGPSTGLIVSAISAAGCLVLVGGSVFSQYGGKASQALQHFALWLGILVALIGGYTYRFDLQSFGQRIIGAVVPGTAVDEGDGKVVITRQGDDSFILAGEVNGQSTRFVFDTGADLVVLTAESAERFELRIPETGYSVSVSTANGVTDAAPITLREVAIGSIRVQNVEALVARPGALATNLLGMSFLSRLRYYGVQGDRLTLEAN
jgi:aspartyl protease family protein